MLCGLWGFCLVAYPFPGLYSFPYIPKSLLNLYCFISALHLKHFICDSPNLFVMEKSYHYNRQYSIINVRNSCRGSRTHPTQTRLNHFRICKFYSQKCFSLTDNEQLLSIHQLSNHRHCSSGNYFQIRISTPGKHRTSVRGFGDLILANRQTHISSINPVQLCTITATSRI